MIKIVTSAVFILLLAMLLNLIDFNGYDSIIYTIILVFFIIRLVFITIEKNKELRKHK